ncbi:DUF1702 family protein [Brevibacillus humidisoli]|uniref:DUF1702 family protein n=1 Tax=Brevibacillus humidisoli TaxID=2895522 RepID=UPI001E521AF3|nr:DUF1702 family protein [Brevibacillus humidisoli]UFJ42434.1 DUF1702 family protein [Brevibacillus humidisoli]
MSERAKRMVASLFFRLLHQDPSRYERQFLRPDGRSFYNERFAIVLQAFFTGYNSGLRTELSVREIRTELDQRFDPFYRGFAYEGLGMGLAARSDVIRKGRLTFEYDIRQIDPGYIYQYYVGLGWWLHTRYRYRSEKYRRRLAVLHPHFALIIYDGVGFKTGLFHKADITMAIDRFSRFAPDEQRVCWQGFGRSLWFLNQFDSEQTVQAVGRLPSSVRADVYSGVGLAIAYSAFDYPDWPAHARSLVEPVYHPAFDQGLAFGWETRRLQNRPYYQQMLAGYPAGLPEQIEQMVAAVHTARQRVSEITSSELFYSRWIDETRRLLTI